LGQVMHADRIMSFHTAAVQGAITVRPAAANTLISRDATAKSCATFARGYAAVRDAQFRPNREHRPAGGGATANSRVLSLLPGRPLWSPAPFEPRMTLVGKRATTRGALRRYAAFANPSSFACARSAAGRSTKRAM
jgi:hypothetical protein